MPMTATAADITVTATVDQQRVALQDQFTLSVEVTGSDANRAGDPALPAMDSFAAYAGVSTGQSIQIINGRMSVSRTYNYVFIATTVGKYEIGPVTVEYKGEKFNSQPFTIEVVQGSAQPSQPQRGQAQPQATEGGDLGNALFVKAQVDRRRVFQNEPVVVSYKIYTRVTVNSYGVSQLPNFAGFWAEDFPLPQQPRTTQEVIDGQRYLIAEIKKVALFPQSTGKKTLEPLKIECDVQMQDRRRRNDIFDSFFDDPFMRRTVRRAVASSPVEIEVEPLPEEGKPTDFSGAVGNYELTATLDKSIVKTNEAITLKVVVRGTGNLRVLAAPKLELPADFETYDPKIDQTIKYDNNRVSGSKTFEYVLVPRSAGDIELKPVRLSFFEPKSRAYKTTSSQPLILNVEKGSEEFAAVGGGFSKEDVRLIGQDIRFIATAPLPFHRIGEAFHNSPIFYAMVISPVFALGLTLLYRRHQEKLSANVAYARQRQAGKVAGKHLRAARALIGKQDSKAFYAEAQRALMSFIGNKLNIAEAGLVTDNLAAMLQERKVSQDVIDAYVRCLQTCDFKRFAPGENSENEMKEFIEQASEALEKMERAI
jgi:hypothetical protein